MLDLSNVISMKNDQPRLIGGRHKTTSQYVFPCPDDTERFEPVLLGTEGVLWSYTVQRFPPKAPYKGVSDPAGFTPYYVGYVELPGEIIVESRLDVETSEGLEIGQALDLVLVPFERQDGQQGDQIFSFRPRTGQIKS